MVTLGQIGDEAARVGNAGQSCFGHETYVLTSIYGVKIVGDIGGGSMLIEFQKGGLVDGVFVAHTFEIPSGSADVFNDEGVTRVEQLSVVCGQGVVGVVSTDGDGEQYEACLHGIRSF